ncbi:MAG: exodeoxyribonuclease VII small subunit [Bacteroidetes bacterium]|nr:exodeoxyribonuclease VII small subunit [Bacteroidota bacterium]
MAKQKKENSFEDNIQRVQEIVDQLNHADLPLKDAIALHSEASMLIKASNEYLQKVTLQFETLE